MKHSNLKLRGASFSHCPFVDVAPYGFQSFVKENLGHIVSRMRYGAESFLLELAYVLPFVVGFLEASGEKIQRGVVKFTHSLNHLKKWLVLLILLSAAIFI